MRTRLLTRILPIVALAIAALTAVAVTTASRSQRDAVYDQMSQLIGKEANRFDARARADQAVADDLAATLEADLALERERGAATIRHLAERNPRLLGVWAGFEPDAFDGRDAEFVKRGPLGDRTGRFAVWAQRTSGPLEVKAFEDPADAPWDQDDYYTQPLKARGDVVMDPYKDNGVMMTSYTTAIMRGGHAARRGGRRRVTGRARQAGQGPSTCSTAATRTSSPPTGKLARVPAEARLGRQKRRQAAPADRLDREGKDPDRAAATDVFFTAPVETGGWTFVAVAPKDEILAPVAALRNKLILVGLLALLIARRRARVRRRRSAARARGRRGGGADRATATSTSQVTAHSG